MPVELPPIQRLHDILPEEPLLMMGAGPVPIPEPVAAANGIVINHLGETMSRVLEQVKGMGRYIFQTETPWLMGVAGPGSAAMEMAVINLVERGDRVLSVCNGFFSNRLSEMAGRVGRKDHILESILIGAQQMQPTHPAGHILGDKITSGGIGAIAP